MRVRALSKGTGSSLSPLVGKQILKVAVILCMVDRAVESGDDGWHARVFGVDALF